MPTIYTLGKVPNTKAALKTSKSVKIDVTTVKIVKHMSSIQTIMVAPL